jgi:hypothetical protein
MVELELRSSVTELFLHKSISYTRSSVSNSLVLIIAYYIHGNACLEVTTFQIKHQRGMGGNICFGCKSLDHLPIALFVCCCLLCRRHDPTRAVSKNEQEMGGRTSGIVVDTR